MSERGDKAKSCRLCNNRKIPYPTTQGIVNRTRCDFISNITHNNTRETAHAISYENVSQQTLLEFYYNPCRINQIRDITMCLLQTVSLLHSADPPTIHRNINPSVIVVSENRVEFLDFFLTHTKRMHLNFFDDPINQCNAPELICPNPQKIDGFACDVFSVGCCIFYLITGKNPFGETYKDIALNLADPNFKLSFECIDTASGIEKYKKLLAYDLVKQMILKNPSQRITIGKAIEHPFFWKPDQIDKYLKDNYAHLEQLGHYATDEYTKKHTNLIKERVGNLIQDVDFAVILLKELPFALMSLFNVVEAESHIVTYEKFNNTSKCYYYERTHKGRVLLRGQYEKRNKKTELTILNESLATLCGYCTYGYGNKCGILYDRLHCEVVGTRHYVVYEKFDYTLRTFVEDGTHDVRHLKTIFKGLVNQILRLRKVENNCVLDISPDTICITKKISTTKKNTTFHGHLLDTSTLIKTTSRSDAANIAACMLYAHTKNVVHDLETFNFLDVDTSLQFLSMAANDKITVDDIAKNTYFWSKSDHERYKKLYQPSIQFQHPISNKKFCAVRDEHGGFLLCEQIRPSDVDMSSDGQFVIEWLSEITDGTPFRKNMGCVYKITNEFACIQKTQYICTVNMKKIKDCIYELPSSECLSIEHKLLKQNELVAIKRKNTSQEIELSKRIKLIH